MVDAETDVSVPLVVDVEYVANHTIQQILDPIWWHTNMYGSRAEYVASQAGFTNAQRLIYAVFWYFDETGNGGHDQFFFNSTGVLWPEALAGLEALSLQDGANILRGATRRLGGGAALERVQRQAQLDQMDTGFDDLDEQLAAFAVRGNVDTVMLDYARANPSAFAFSGTIRIPQTEAALRRRHNAKGETWAVPLEGGGQ